MKRFIVVVAVVVASLVSVAGVQAQLATADCSGAFTVDSLQPSTVSSTAGGTLVVTGSGFSDGASVILENYGGLQTTFVNSNVLNAALPPTLPPGVYG